MNRFALAAIAVLISACTTATAHQPLTIQEQGSFAVGGTVVTVTAAGVAREVFNAETQPR